MEQSPDSDGTHSRRTNRFGQMFHALIMTHRFLVGIMILYILKEMATRTPLKHLRRIKKMSTSDEYKKQQELKRDLQKIISEGPDPNYKPRKLLSVEEWKKLGLPMTSTYASVNPLSDRSARRPNNSKQKPKS